jgi:hypothetical protein
LSAEVASADGDYEALLEVPLDAGELLGPDEPLVPLEDPLAPLALLVEESVVLAESDFAVSPPEPLPDEPVERASLR